jgi:hypothetical protein
MSIRFSWPRLLPVLLLLAGCYNTKGIQSGGLICGDKGSCPDGFVCDKTLDPRGPGRCYTPSDLASLAKRDAGTSAPEGCPNPELPFGPFAGCKQALPTDTSSCDPVCQSPCPCGRRCVTDKNTQSYFCEATAPSQPFAKHMERCDGKSPASTCTPGAFCLQDGSPNNAVCGSYCYTTCRVDADCPSSSRCTVNSMVPADANVTMAASVHLCSPPREACNPIGAAPTCLGSRGAGFACILTASVAPGATSEESMCDCKATYTLPIGAACKDSSLSCVPGAVCVEGTCRQLCLLGAGGTCANRECKDPVFGSSRYGWCL